jgi:hypothetical protein
MKEQMAVVGTGEKQIQSFRILKYFSDHFL